jgi:hypothetical protein
LCQQLRAPLVCRGPFANQGIDSTHVVFLERQRDRIARLTLAQRAILEKIDDVRTLSSIAEIIANCRLEYLSDQCRHTSETSNDLGRNDSSRRKAAIFAEDDKFLCHYTDAVIRNQATRAQPCEVFATF